MDTTHINRYTLAFIIIVGGLLYAVLMIPDAESDDTVVAVAGDATICCVFNWHNTEKTCAAVDGQTCDVCRTICDAKENAPDNP
ncbi:TPA: hypothetical protein HA251_01275 [Candidatus Woesearchaeota archaeon]|nr:hypothetical protein [Candidatus Woesearchaeota archaeon]